MFSTVFGGDFNCVDNPVIDRTEYDPKILKTYLSTNLLLLFETFDLTNAFRAIFLI